MGFEPTVEHNPTQPFQDCTLNRSDTSLFNSLFTISQTFLWYNLFMIKFVLRPQKSLKGFVTIPSDKSISHRAVIFSSLAEGSSVINNFSKGADPMSSLAVCKALGVQTEFRDENSVVITSSGILKKPCVPLDCGNSGTTMRLMTGLLAGQNFESVLTGDESLSKRPMKRVIEPISLMGANIQAVNGHAPLKVSGNKLCGIDYVSKLASAQVKSCVLLAGLFAEGHTRFTEPYLSRNHTEIMLKYMGADIKTDGCNSMIKPSKLNPVEIDICGDISSAAFFIVAGLIVPDSDIILKNVGLNPTRTGIIDIVKRMGGRLQILDETVKSGEFVGDIRVQYSDLKGCKIEKDLIPRLIDELPVIAVLATQAQGETIVKNAEDLRNKESDRIKAVVGELAKLGANIKETPDGFVVCGKTSLTGGVQVESYHDHRLAMSLYVAGLVCEKSIGINGFEWVDISFPEFESLISNLSEI